MSVKSIEDLKQKYSTKFDILYNRKNTLQALKNFFGVEEISEKSMANLRRNYFIGKKISQKNYQTTSYKNLLEHLTDYYLEHYRNAGLMENIVGVMNTYTRFLCEITDVDAHSNDYVLHVRKFDEVLKEFYEFAVAHKSIVKLKNAHIIQSLKKKINYAKAEFDYSKKGLNFLNFNSLKELDKLISSWYGKSIWYDCTFDFNNQNLKKVISSSINKNVKFS